MTVRDLIKQLQEMPQDEEVFCVSDGFTTTQFDEVEFVEYEPQPVWMSDECAPMKVVIHFGS